mgnify:CR=1 FL=1
MGYRSEVALAVSSEIMPHFLNVLAEQPEARSLIFKEHSHFDQNYAAEGTMLVVWHDIKWYTESDSVVGAIQRFVDDCESDLIEDFDDASEHIRFVRIGEEFDDIENKGSLHCYDICTSRSLMY